MKTEIIEAIKQEVRRVVELLVARDYETLKNVTVDPPVPVADFASHLGSFGWTLVMPPNNAFEQVSYFASDGHDTFPDGPSNGPAARQFCIYEVAAGREWKIDFALWTAEHGQSDLTLKLNITAATGKFQVQLYDALVM